MAESVIKITPEELRTAANTLNNEQSVILDHFNTMKTTVDNLDANWDGAAQTQYFETFNNIYSQFTQQIQEVVDGLEKMLTGAAEAFESADDQVAAAMKM